MKKFLVFSVAIIAFLSSCNTGSTGIGSASSFPTTLLGTVATGGANGDGYVILSETGITTTVSGPTSSAITGNIGTSPIGETAITGFALTDAGTYATSALVTGDVYAATMASPTPSNLTTAIGDMQTAYTTTAGLPNATGANLNIGSGNLNGNTFAPGTYTWGSNVSINGNVTLSGSSTDIWVFQISGTLVDNGFQVNLTGGAQAKNVFWQVAGGVTLLPSSQFSGIILSKTLIAMQALASLKGRALAQTAVTLIANTITQP